MRDVVIIGAGPVGLACAIEAQRRGLEALILEKGALVNSFLGYPTNLEFFSTPELMEIGDHAFPTMGYKPVREEAIEYYRRVAQLEELDIRVYEPVTGLQGEDGAFTVATERGRYECRKVVTATGFFDVPNRLDVPGEDLPKVTHYYKEPFPYTGQRVAVVGGRNSAAKAALSCYRHAADVTLVVRGPGISEKVKYWIRPDLENRIAEGSIRAFFSTSVEAIQPTTLRLHNADGSFEIENDWVLAMTGYRPNYDLLDRLGGRQGRLHVRLCDPPVWCLARGRFYRPQPFEPAGRQLQFVFEVLAVHGDERVAVHRRDGAEGLSFGGLEDKMGWRSQPTRQVQLDNCPVPADDMLGEEGRGFRYAMAGLDGGRLNIAACSLGAAQAGLDEHPLDLGPAVRP